MADVNKQSGQLNEVTHVASSSQQTLSTKADIQQVIQSIHKLSTSVEEWKVHTNKLSNTLTSHNAVTTKMSAQLSQMY